MKKRTLEILTVGMLFLPIFTFAENNVNRNPKPLMPQVKEIKQKISSTSPIMMERRDERRENLLRIAKNIFEKLIDRFEATIDREIMISSKIKSRIEKVKSLGGNTVDAEKYVDEANIHINEAKTALLNLKNASTSADTLVNANTSTSTIVKTELKKIKEMTQNVEKHIREAHQSLTKAVKTLRGMSTTATTTPKSDN